MRKKDSTYLDSNYRVYVGRLVKYFGLLAMDYLIVGFLPW